MCDKVDVDVWALRGGGDAEAEGAENPYHISQAGRKRATWGNVGASNFVFNISQLGASRKGVRVTWEGL